ncbi:5'-nucleotidase C-terminal domain-containing protein [Haliovirga abyssi]|uniref:Endonuclease/exonuclease/phosphatase n=1 Tax=Haliovirga abyssi TaxID=2996794 RepID=A0AAU9DGJ7_9FUSO|nr:5'-nucleotidase C-terminal domain-containing protein [Haliovirga abyssi]BDU51383.1 hypothetical protein HLVA_19520 [Haliovirga abyssi]
MNKKISRKKTIKKKYILTALIAIFLFTACEKDITNRKIDESYNTINVSLDNQKKLERSTEAANLITTAVKEELDVDVVLYPTENLNLSDKNLKINLLKTDITDKINMTVDQLKSVYSTDANKDNILLMYIKGSDLKKFILQRATENYGIDVQTAGLDYNIIFKGGRVEEATMSINGKEVEDSKEYKIAFMLYAYGNNPDSGLMINFPGYYYKNSFNYKDVISTDYKATDLLIKYITDLKGYKDFSVVRDSVKNLSKPELDYIIPIYTIQGDKFVSDYTGKVVKTRGVITATVNDDYNRMHGFYLQDETGDGNDYTSDAIYVNTTAEIMSSPKIAVGEKIEIEGTVYEEFSNNNISRTTLRDIKIENVKSLGKGVMPKSVLLGGTGNRKIPNNQITTIKGDINNNVKINLEEGLGFWESLEGMKVKVLSPIVTGSSGGFEDKYVHKSYINLFVRPKGVSGTEQVTPVGGLIIDVDKNDYNPEIIRIVDNEFKSPDGTFYGKYDSKNGFKGGEKIFNVGDRLADLEGIASFALNDFGSGEYVFYPMSKVDNLESNRSDITPISDRYTTSLVGDADHITVGTYNVENLGGEVRSGKAGYSSKWDDIGEVIAKNMKAPDILVINEVQDNDGNQNSSVTDATVTLEKIISGIEKAGGPTDYKIININPIAYADGGEPGGNIRPATIYRSTRVEFDRRGNAGAKDHVGLDENGDLKYNPGRVYPNTPIFEGTRKSVAMEFKFKGKKIIVIGNHLNSKGGDTSMWGGTQPVKFYTEIKRVKLAKIVNGFSKEILGKNPNANLLLIGDFNEFYASAPMRVLEGKEFINLIDTKIPYNKRYTYNYSGNSQAIDHVFISKELQKESPEVDIIYVNTDYMGKISDHNPVVSRYKF